MYGRRGVDSTSRAARNRLRWCTTVPGLRLSRLAMSSTDTGLPSARTPTMRRRDASDSALRATRRSGSMAVTLRGSLMNVKSCNPAQIGRATYDDSVERSAVEQVDERRIGPHLPLGAGLLKAAARAEE